MEIKDKLQFLVFLMSIVLIHCGKNEYSGEFLTPELISSSEYICNDFVLPDTFYQAKYKTYNDRINMPSKFISDNCNLNKIFDVFTNISIDTEYIVDIKFILPTLAPSGASFYIRNKSKNHDNYLEHIQLFYTNISKDSLFENYEEFKWKIKYKGFEILKLNGTINSYFEMYAVPIQIKKYSRKMTFDLNDEVILLNDQSLEEAKRKIQKYNCPEDNLLFTLVKDKIDLTQKIKFDDEYAYLSMYRFNFHEGVIKDSLRIRKEWPHEITMLKDSVIISYGPCKIY